MATLGQLRTALEDLIAVMGGEPDRKGEQPDDYFAALGGRKPHSKATTRPASPAPSRI